mgnify:CR=1 FL=1
MLTITFPLKINLILDTILITGLISNKIIFKVTIDHIDQADHRQVQTGQKEEEIIKKT